MVATPFFYLGWARRAALLGRPHAERYQAVLAQARVPTQVVTIEGGDHDFAPAEPRAEMARVVAEWASDASAASVAKGRLVT